MDWSRAKTILVISFLLLNLLLGYQLWYGNTSPVGSNTDAVLAAEQILMMNNILLSAKVPTETPKLREITVSIMPSISQPPLVHLSVPIQVSELQDKSFARNVVNRHVPDGESYQYDPFDSKDFIHVFHQMQGLYPMFDVKLELLEQDGMIYAFRQSHAEVLLGAVEKEQRVLSGIEVISILAEKYLSSGSNIVDIQLGYHGQAFNSETRVLAPYWRIVTEQGERYFVHAITGAVE